MLLYGRKGKNNLKKQTIRHIINDILKQLNKTVRKNKSILTSQNAISEYWLTLSILGLP